MQLSLSVRIVEAPCKSRLRIPLEELVAIARETGFAAVCMRASAGGVGTPIQRLEEMRKCVVPIRPPGLPLVRGDRGPDCGGGAEASGGGWRVALGRASVPVEFGALRRILDPIKSNGCLVRAQHGTRANPNQEVLHRVSERAAFEIEEPECLVDE